MQHWVDFGSLLGLVRSGDLILHDNDVDVVVLDPDWPQLQEQLSARLGHKYRVRRPSRARRGVCSEAPKAGLWRGGGGGGAEAGAVVRCCAGGGGAPLGGPVRDVAAGVLPAGDDGHLRRARQVSGAARAAPRISPLFPGDPQTQVHVIIVVIHCTSACRCTCMGRPARPRGALPDFEPRSRDSGAGLLSSPGSETSQLGGELRDPGSQIGNSPRPQRLPDRGGMTPHGPPLPPKSGVVRPELELLHTCTVARGCTVRTCWVLPTTWGGDAGDT